MVETTRQELTKTQERAQQTETLLEKAQKDLDSLTFESQQNKEKTALALETAHLMTDTLQEEKQKLKLQISELEVQIKEADESREIMYDPTPSF